MMGVYVIILLASNLFKNYRSLKFAFFAHFHESRVYKLILIFKTNSLTNFVFLLF